MANIKLKKILKEDFTRTLAGGIVTMKPSNQISLSNIVKEKYGDAEEVAVDVKQLTAEITNYQKIGESIFLNDVTFQDIKSTIKIYNSIAR